MKMMTKKMIFMMRQMSLLMMLMKISMKKMTLTLKMRSNKLTTLTAVKFPPNRKKNNLKGLKLLLP